MNRMFLNGDGKGTASCSGHSKSINHQQQQKPGQFDQQRRNTRRMNHLKSTQGYNNTCKHIPVFSTAEQKIYIYRTSILE